MATLQTTIERDDGEIDITVEFKYSKGMRGARDRFGVPLEPDDEEEIEIQSVTDNTGKELDLTNEELEAIESRCWDRIED